MLDRNRLASVDCRRIGSVLADLEIGSDVFREPAAEHTFWASVPGPGWDEMGSRHQRCGTVDANSGGGVFINGLHANSPESLETFTGASVSGTVPESLTRVGRVELPGRSRMSRKYGYLESSVNGTVYESVRFD